MLVAMFFQLLPAIPRSVCFQNIIDPGASFSSGGSAALAISSRKSWMQRWPKPSVTHQDPKLHKCNKLWEGPKIAQQDVAGILVSNLRTGSGKFKLNTIAGSCFGYLQWFSTVLITIPYCSGKMWYVYTYIYTFLCWFEFRILHSFVWLVVLKFGPSLR